MEEVNAELGALYLGRILGLAQAPGKERYESHMLGKLKVSKQAFAASREHAITAVRYLTTLPSRE